MKLKKQIITINSWSSDEINYKIFCFDNIFSSFYK